MSNNIKDSKYMQWISSKRMPKHEKSPLYRSRRKWRPYWKRSVIWNKFRPILVVCRKSFVQFTSYSFLKKLSNVSGTFRTPCISSIRSKLCKRCRFKQVIEKCKPKQLELIDEERQNADRFKEKFIATPYYCLPRAGGQFIVEIDALKMEASCCLQQKNGPSK